MSCAVCKKCGAFGSDVCPSAVAYVQYTGRKGGQAGTGASKIRETSYRAGETHADRMKRIMARIKQETI
jgi:hypothetical protein